MIECPSCDKDVQTEHGLKIHHSTVHGESLVEKSECEVCDSEYRTPPSHNSRFCSQDCYTEWQKGKECSIICEVCEDKKSVSPERASRMKFCSYECYYEARSGMVKGDSNPNWRGGNPDYYGENWMEQRQKAIERDDGKCQVCGDDSDVHVHHIIPIRKFDEPEHGNFPANLIVLCPTHHRTLEGKDYKTIMRNKR